MEHKSDQLKEAIKRIFTTQGDEISCDEASPMMARCADAQLTTQASQKLYPQLWQHFQFCPDCTAEYEMIMDLAAMSDEAKVVPSSIPSRPKLNETSLWEQISERLQITFPGFSTQFEQALARGNDLDFEPVILMLEPTSIELELDVGIHESETSLRDIYCHFAYVNEQDNNKLEGSNVWIGEQDIWPKQIEDQILNSFGDVSFSRLEVGKAYNLAIHIEGMLFEITGIQLP